MKKIIKKFILIWCIILLLTITLAYAHSGRTDQYGCHTCRTNCEEKWGIPYGFYHRHNPVRPCFEEETEAIQIPTQPITEPEQTTEQSPELNKPTTPIKTEVYRVIDGDTIELTNGERVRLIGIDSTEVGQCYYFEAKKKLEDLIQGKEVRLDKDISERDRYGRLLNYVYIDNIFINYELVRQGYAKAYRYEPDVKFADKFKEAENKAKEENLGLWNKCFSSSQSEDINTKTITAKVIEEKIENISTIMLPNKTTKEIEKPIIQETNLTKENKSLQGGIIPQETNLNKNVQKELVKTSAKKEKGFFQLIRSWFLRLFK